METETRVNLDTNRLLTFRDAALDTSAVSRGNSQTATVHEFYRYPARFPPSLARTGIEAFTKPGDLVVDPFLGGGTVLVESLLLGRPSLGSDLNPLATFVSRAKTTVYTPEALAKLSKWCETLPPQLNLQRKSVIAEAWQNDAYLRCLDTPETWRIRKILALALMAIENLAGQTGEALARCALLRTAQWALDMRRELPMAQEFRAAFERNLRSMIDAASRFRTQVPSSGDPDLGRHADVVVLDQALPGLAQHPAVRTKPKPKLIFTSPPYPGVYALYHRWKLQSRKEIAAPYWVAGSLDGHGQAHYTMGARSDTTSERYFSTLRTAFLDIAEMAGSETWVVQVVGFHDPGSQLSMYLNVMNEVGLDEVLIPVISTHQDGRLWREVPGRRWWTHASSKRGLAGHTAREVVLIHQLH